MGRILSTLLAVLGWAGGGAAARGAEPAADPGVVQVEDQGDKWEFIVAPYVWTAGVEGDMTVKGLTADVDLGIDDVLENLDGALMGYFELRKRQFGFYANPFYMKVSEDASSRGREFDLEQQMWIIEAGGFYNLARWGQDKPLVVDAFAGARYWNNGLDLKFSGPLIGTVEGGGTSELIDPIVGLRASRHLTKRISLMLRGDVGGFGLTGDTSEFSWQATGMLGYDFSKSMSAFGGYRALALDTVHGSGANKEGTDVVFHGPILGMQFKF